MAGVGKSKLKTQPELSMDIGFDGIVQTSTRANLIIEYIKYLVYQRQLIPLPYDQIKDDENHPNPRQHEHRLPGRHVQTLQASKRHKTVECLEQIFSAIEDTFRYNSPVRRVLIMFGATTASPKEAFEVVFPTSFYDSHVLSNRLCKTVFFQHLVLQDWFSELNPLPSSTRIHVLVEAPNHGDSTFNRMLPRMNFKMPQRGNFYRINVSCIVNPSPAELSQMWDNDFEISGVEPMNLSVADNDGLVAGRRCSLRSLSCSPHRSLFPTSCAKDCDVDASSPDISMQDENGPSVYGSEAVEDYMWYQIPVAAVGYKDKTSKRVTSQNGF